MIEIKRIQQPDVAEAIYEVMTNVSSWSTLDNPESSFVPQPGVGFPGNSGESLTEVLQIADKAYQDRG